MHLTSSTISLFALCSSSSSMSMHAPLARPPAAPRWVVQFARTPRWVQSSVQAVDHHDDGGGGIEMPTPSPRNPKFQAMMTRVGSYSPAQLTSIDDVRLRSLLRGVATAATTPEVLASFEVLYEDFLPIRTAGSFMFDALDVKVQQASKKLDEVRESIGASEEEADAAAQVFSVMDADGNGKLTVDEVACSGMFDVLVRQIGDDTGVRNVDEVRCWPLLLPKGDCAHMAALYLPPPEPSLPLHPLLLSDCVRAVQFVRRLDRDNDGVVSYLEMLEGSQLLFGEEISEGFVETNKLLRELLATRGVVDDDDDDDCPVLSEGSPGGQGRNRGARNPTRHGDRYDEMVETFLEWEEAQSELGEQIKNSRLRTVLDGCFVGARTPPVVEALKIVYEDYYPLRVAGDLIFRLMKSFVFKDRRR